MLKIKDNINLKELEKFGFTTSKKVKDKYNFDTKLVKAVFKSEDDFNAMTISNKRSIDLTDYFENINWLDTLYDLIKADLVEKVDDNNGK